MYAIHFLSILLFIVSTRLLSAEALFSQYFLACEKEIKSVYAEDLNGDQRKDILLFYIDEKSHQRWFALYFQNENGFAEQAVQRFPIPHDVSLFDFGDVADTPGIEFVTISAGTIHYHVLTDSGYIRQPQQFKESESIFIYPDWSRIRRWNFVRDVNDDGLDDILIPKFDRTTLLLQSGSTSTWQENHLNLLPQSRPFSYFDPRFSVGDKAGALFEVPYLLFQDFDNDTLSDIIAIYKDSINVYVQNENHHFSNDARYVLAINHGEIWSGAKIMRTHLDDKNERQFLMRLIDIDGDGVLDIVSSFISTKHSLINPETYTSVFLGRKSQKSEYTFSTDADFVIEPDGTQMVIDIFDFNKDGNQDFLIPTIKIGVTSIIKMLLTRSINFDAHLFLMHENQRFTKEAQRKISMNVRFSFRGGAASPIYEIADFNNDGLLDILASADEEMLMLYYGNKKNSMDSNPGAHYKILLPQDGTLVKASHLNADGRADIIVRYEPGKLEMAGMQNGIFVLLGNADR
ncbi:MAG: VCBS repeat-containing protein [Calditrichaeota bacterium]|nr:MAG: VCBS repeat-containing protein [Calditrichota bacterium]